MGRIDELRRLGWRRRMRAFLSRGLWRDKFAGYRSRFGIGRRRIGGSRYETL